MIVGPDQLIVGIDDVKHDDEVFVEPRIRGGDEFVGDVDGTAERGSVAAEHRRSFFVTQMRGPRRFVRGDEFER